MPTDIKRLRTAKEMTEETDVSDRICTLAAGMHMGGNYVRMSILFMLIEHGEMSVGTLAKYVNKPSSVISLQLAELRENNLVKMRRDTTTHYYTCSDHPFVRIIWAAIQEMVHRRHVSLELLSKPVPSTEVVDGEEPQAAQE